VETSEILSGGSRRALLGGATVAAAGLLAALALVFTNATGVTEVAADARAQQQIESAIGSTAAARNAIGQALLVATALRDQDLTAGAVVEAHRSLDTLEQRVASVAGLLDDPGPLDAELDVALAEGRNVLAALSIGDVGLAGDITTGSAAAAYGSLADALDQERARVSTRIAAAASESSTVATASRFMVAFFVPTVAVVVTLFGIRRRRRREQLSVALEHERAVNRSKDQLIANLSHELRTPLTGIYTAALALEDTGYSEPVLATELNGMIIEQSADLTRMVEDLLVSAQADAGRLRFDLAAADIDTIVRSLGSEFMRSGADILIETEAAHVLVDDGRLRQILRNLISNAVRYGGSTIEIEGRIDGSDYLLAVSDNGPGVPPDLQVRLFERFVHQGDAPLIVGSVGLGLAISRVLARGMRGEISYRRDNGRTTFEVTVPRAVDPNGPMPPDPNPTHDPTIVDDEIEADVKD
jgi:two-component system OmpR family sensor kinase